MLQMVLGIPKIEIVSLKKKRKEKEIVSLLNG